MAFNISAFGINEHHLPDLWKTDRFDSIAILNPEQIKENFPYDTIAYLDIANVASGLIGKPVQMRLADAPSRAKRIVRPCDTILSTVRPGNRAYAYIRDVSDNLIVSTGFAVLRAKRNKGDARFVYYLATSDPIINYLASIAEERTAYPSVNPNDIAECEIPIPPFPEQCYIGHVLGALDDKIELNRLMSETLESMAQVIFKSWFVDFDPVRAKMEHRPPASMDTATAALFPNSFQNSALGQIPKGWKVGKMTTLVTLSRDTISPGEYPEDTFLHYSIPAFDEGRWPKLEFGRDIKSNKFIISNSCVLLSKLNPRIPRVWMPDVNLSKQSISSTEFLVLLPNGGFTREYIYAQLQADNFLDRFATMVTGTSGSHQRVQPESLLEMEVTIPGPEVITAYSSTVRSLLRRALANQNELRTLAAIRDALLPHLIAGSITIHR